MVAKQWYFRETDGSEYGPMSGPELRELTRSGRIRRETFVRTDASDRWVTASQVKGLFPDGRPNPGPAAVTASASRHQPYSQPRRPTPNNPFALASLISGVLGWTLVPVLGAGVAIVTGHIALRQIEASDGREDGKVLAVIGLILGYVEAVFLFVAAISLLLLGIGLSGFLGVFLHHAEKAAKDEAKRRRMDPPKFEKPEVFAPFLPPSIELRGEAFAKAEALARLAAGGPAGDFIVPLVRFADLGDASDGHLRRESEPLPDECVVGLPEYDFVGDLESERLPGKPIGGLVEPLDGGLEPLGAVTVGEELNSQGHLHVFMTDTMGH